MVSVEQINIRKSIDEEKLILNKTYFDKVFNLVLKIFLISIFPLITLIYSFNHAELFSQDKFGYIMSILFSLIIAYLLYNYFVNADEIKIIKGKNISHNKNVMISIAKKLEWKIYANEVM